MKDGLTKDKQTGDNQRSTWLKKHKYSVTVLMMVYDLVVIHFAYFGALWSRFDFTYSSIPGDSSGLTRNPSPRTRWCPC